MKSLFARSLAAFLVVLLFTQQNWATCGGGGGGGVGGMGGGGGNGMGTSNDQTYRVPWKLIKPEDPPVKDGLVVYWFPSSADEVKKSSLLFSHSLALYAGQCSRRRSRRRRRKPRSRYPRDRLSPRSAPPTEAGGAPRRPPRGPIDRRLRRETPHPGRARRDTHAVP